MSTPDHWPTTWQSWPQEQRDTLTRIMAKYSGLLDGYDPEATVPSWQHFTEAMHWQNLEVEVLEGHTRWLRRTKAMFERRGWPWTTAELLARAHIREAGE